MSAKVDARGLSCPQPVLMTLNEIKTGKTSEVEILVDTETSKENVSRAATSQGWKVTDVSEEGDEHKITIKRK
ncbi:MAG: sulfurtransferase TusA family protein [Deltaproteobacteria bacterium]|nr:sulfurtransferase TusA family protein [Deltaproteobacteria bacterium]MBW2594748.1 sulfurtransferase TusA family protein [Deltaproteobacteria bacterium]